QQKGEVEIVSAFVGEIGDLGLKHGLADLASIVLDDGGLSSDFDAGLGGEFQLQGDIECGADCELYLARYFGESVSLCGDLIFADGEVWKPEPALIVALDDVALIGCKLDRGNCGSGNHGGAGIEDATGNAGFGEGLLRVKQCGRDQEKRQGKGRKYLSQAMHCVSSEVATFVGLRAYRL